MQIRTRLHSTLQEDHTANELFSLCAHILLSGDGYYKVLPHHCAQQCDCSVIGYRCLAIIAVLSLIFLDKGLNAAPDITAS